ncbi:MAG: hypothetical protein JWR69_4523 [Pedosphaera sp.]|nr:hypothetical protein [Pedosphaera sp.]
MLTVTCTLTFPDGHEATGSIEARSPGMLYDITYAGAWDRLTLRPEQGTAWDLELVFKLLAIGNGATFHVERCGEYESRAELLRHGWPVEVCRHLPHGPL